METNVVSFTFTQNLSIARLSTGVTLLTTAKPTLGFEYDELWFTENAKEYVKDEEIFQFTETQKAAVIAHMLTIYEEEDVQLSIEADPEASRKINASDWRLQQYWEQKELVRLGVLSEIYITEAEYTDILIERQRLRDIAGSPSE
jgi:hypothetical protein